MLDDWGLAPLTGPQRHDLLEVLADRTERASTLITSQLPITAWHEAIGDPTLADAICDRLVQTVHVIELQGRSMREVRAHTQRAGPRAAELQTRAPAKPVGRDKREPK